MKTYLRLIKYLQYILLTVSIGIMAILPLIIVFSQNGLSAVANENLFLISHIFLLFVMIIRPLADIFPTKKWIRPLVILRKGTGVLSASIIISFILAKLIVDPFAYVHSLGTIQYWSLENYALLAHLADISAILLIITSNNFSKKLLGSAWKKIQKLSYLYFYGSTLFVFLSYGDLKAFASIIIITIVTIIATILNNERNKTLATNTPV